MATVVELTSYPVKGCAGVPVSDALLTEAGLRHDRSFMVIGEDGECRTQRRDPRLAVIRPAIDLDGTRLTLSAPGEGEVAIDIDTTSTRREVKVFHNPFLGIDQGDDAATWLSQALGAPSRLVRVPPEHDRVTEGWIPGTCGYADSGAVHLVSRASLDGLNRRIAEAGGAALPMNRFRPGIVLGGWDEPHREDRIRRIAIGGAELGFAKLTGRCVVTTVDQSKGVKAGPEPLRTLAGYRRGPDGATLFGCQFSVTRAGKLAVGDEVDVIEWDGPPPGE
ncbi:MOSC N-terminal beta barrel domain-containing protein [Streptomyces antimycoticus]|uniref:Molybdenum cofactor sulfurase n=1 Tax=Streptomyces antimycoticus TaxID=68175 RepID=A0A4D4KHP0_9ACTN|nr:MOSC N-terminal beta barrel domain-containing protein [Streptomyces antimycoticus]BBJ38557.1 molybdenum cofactor sulfurase [Streptomyces antimycoticus]GDY47952.1 molybdenum cofactor sulfurase [Streptomyces antimycoticus]